MLRMITDLATIMWVASNMSAGPAADQQQSDDGGGTSTATPTRGTSAAAAAAANEAMQQVNRVLDVCLEESRGRLVDAGNVETFQKNVQVHMRHLEMDLRQGSAAQLAANRMTP